MLEYEILASFSLNFNDMIFSPNFISNRDQLSLISEKKERTSEVCTVLCTIERNKT